jgi:hypothetical protein
MDDPRPDPNGRTLPASEEEGFDQDTSLPASEEGEDELIGDIEEPLSHPGITPPPD